MPKILTIFGTRPEAIKMAPLVNALRKNNEFETKIAVTAQHREMLDQVLGLFQIIPDYDLDIMQHGQTLSQVTSRVLNGLDGILSKERPDLVLVHGDTTTTFVAALASFYQQIPVGHVEAGLRTDNVYSPFPEEMNRRLTGSISNIHLAPTDQAAANLRKENIEENMIFITGNTVIDALLQTVGKDYSFTDPKLIEVLESNSKIILLTTHRRENWGQPMKNIFQAVKELVSKYEGITVVFPIHKNPQIRKLANEILGGLERVVMIEPLDYQPFANLMKNSYMVITDSGGMQEEAPSLGKPVLVLRDTTERPEALNAGTVCLVGTDKAKIMEQVSLLLEDQEQYRKMSKASNPYGDGRACKRIIGALSYYFGITDRPDDFQS